MVIIALTLTAPSLTYAHGKADDLVIENAWGKPNFGPNGAAYLKITNNGSKKIELIEAISPVSNRVELHEHINQDGVMRMRRIKDAITIESKETITFEPAGKHIMLFNMKDKFKAGANFPLTLKFKNGKHKDITVKILSGDKSTKKSSEHQHH